ncbi:PLP-dependent aminotransferase family protein [Plantactinospora sp. BB1]|uniref:MocR-like pyridoxine biosynthesis transcription factor PdxR n=1 Tax=Plantactinospora sp. BB1 TaxID=2071627 RepID=UPI000D175BE9|nr:PLP-dependent aminotransferase family protein [Plantactinospora sp. BB1]AVT39279.1 PLP-dependent aminotransferase family protein [Plantactinospora sp. BB1]
MVVEWAGLGPELLVPLDRTSREPLRAQLEGALRDAIRRGRLRAGERLPSSRELARQLGVSRGLVQDCYGQLHAEGYLRTRTGSATRVAELPAGALAPGPAAAAVARPLRADFAAGVPELASFPRAEWLAAQREAFRLVPNAAFGYGDSRGNPTFRETIAGYLRRVRAAHADPDNIVACGGFAQGLHLALGVLRQAGHRRIAFEDPGYGDDSTLAATARAGLRAVPVPVDAEGIDVDALAATGVRAVVVTPAHQWPTGVVMAPARRQALVAWAIRHDAIIVEDDYDAEFRYDREPVGSLQGLAPDHVVTIGTVSKTLAPAIRLGWMLCPSALTGAVLHDKRLVDRGSSLLDQLTVATLISSGRYDRHLRRMRGRYAARRQALVRALAAYAPMVTLTGLAAGFHAVAHLPAGADERTVIERASAQRIGLYGMSGYRADGSSTPPQLVVGFGNLSEDTIQAAVRVIGTLV